MTMQPLTTGIQPEFGLGDRLRKAREVKGLEQRELAELLGIHRQSVAKYERGEGTPRKPVLMAWAFMTGVDLFWLRGEETPMSDEPWFYDSEGNAKVYTPRDSNPEPTDYGLGALANGSLAAGLLLVRAILSAVRA